MKFTRIDKFVISSPILVIIGYSIPFLSSNTPLNYERIISFLIGGIFWISIYFIIKLIVKNYKKNKKIEIKDLNQNIVNIQNDEHYYERASLELNSDNKKEGLWTKVLVETDGDVEKAKLKYIKLRVEQLINSEKKELEETKIQSINNPETKNFKESKVTSFNGFIILIFLIIFYMIFLILVNEGYI